MNIHTQRPQSIGLLDASEKNEEKYSDTGNRTPGYRVRGDNVSHYTISDVSDGCP